MHSCAFAMEGRDSLFFNDGKTLCTRIHTLNAWSVTLDDGNFIGLKMLSVIKTRDSLLVQQLRSFYPQIDVTVQDSIYTITTAHLRLLPADPYSDDFVYRYFVLLNAMNAPYENIEFQLNLIPRLCHNIVGQITASSGVKFRRDALNVQQATIGIGYFQSLDFIILSLNLNYGYKSLHITDDSPDISKYVTFLSFYARIPFGNNRFLLSLGGRYYLSNLLINTDKRMSSLNIGLGYTFEVSPD
jgi:hypothetical protein